MTIGSLSMWIYACVFMIAILYETANGVMI